MTTIGTTSRPAYVYDADTDTWVPIGVGPHTHDEYVDKVLFDNKGDILVGTGEDTLGKLAVGEDGQFLVVDLDEPTGLTWRTLNANIDVSATAPTGPTSGSVWFNSSEGIAYIYYDSYWVPLSPAQVGPQGDAGVFISDSAPLSTDVLWLDTDEDPDVPVPAGGTNGQVLAKFSSNDYETAWVPQNLRTFADAATRAAAIPSPTEGIVTYLNDTDSLQMYNGSIYTNIANTGRGVLSFQRATNSTAFSANTELNLFTTTVTILPGRLYEFYGRVVYQSSGTAGPRSLFVNSSGGLGAKALFYESTGIGTNLNATMQGTGIFSSTQMGVTSGTGTSRTFQLFLFNGAAGGLNTNPDSYVGASSSEQQFVIRDIGAE